jgi:hypothetical protein
MTPLYGVYVLIAMWVALSVITILDRRDGGGDDY